MKMYAFQVRQDGARSLPALAQLILGQQLQDRTYPGAPSGMRLEAAHVDQRRHLLFLDFARPRGGHGPGQMARTRPIADINLAAGATFGEDTALAFETQTGFAAVQFNQFGPRPTAIQQYLSAADLHFGLRPGQGPFGFTLAPRFRPNAYARLRAFRYVREIDFTISVAGVNRADFDAGRSVGSVLRMPTPEGIRTVTVKMSAGGGRGDTLALDAAFAVLADLEQLGGDLVSGSVTGKVERGDRSSSIDLVDERVSAEKQITPGRGQRYAQPERWIACGDALAEWRARVRTQLA